MIAAFAAGAFAAAGAGQAWQSGSEDAQAGKASMNLSPRALHQPLAEGANAMGGGEPTSPDLLLTARDTSASAAAAQVRDNQRAISAVEAEHAEANRPKYVKPADGRFTSGFEARWGTFHYGIDLAAAPHSPIYAAADGEVIEAGPASGFGLWVRERLDDGTILVYGHMYDFSVHPGHRVKAGEQIARVGMRGESTGYHCHFEVWNPSGKKIDPRPWLAEHGVHV
ncbi:M23 family metallopeptidase [Sciscionella marina]|uniref:M23 family metallopeptidase n=1 Tax=Sciscionella marina TaxID=508770 RepID=UPI00035CC156|nr:M23 family metallopeptidase [Sciscionella marina]